MQGSVLSSSGPIDGSLQCPIHDAVEEVDNRTPIVFFNDTFKADGSVVDFKPL